MHNDFDRAWDLFIKKNNEEAKSVLYTAATLNSDSNTKTKCIDLLCKICLMTQDYVTLEDALSMSKDPRLDYFRMSKLFNDGYDEQAWEMIQCIGRHDRKVHGFYGVGLESLVKNKNWLTDKKTIKIEKNLFVRIKSTTDKKHVILFSADSGYFKRFYRYSLENIHTNPDALFHYHIVNPDSEVIDIIYNQHSDSVNFSFEYVDEQYQSKAYYASSRFFIAPQIFSIYEKPFFIFDIDSKLVGNLDELFETKKWSREKLSLRVSPALELPWQKIVANALYIPFNELGHSFLNRISLYLATSFLENKGRLLWWIDQNALFFTYKSFDKLPYQRWTGLINNYITYPKFLEDKDKSMLNM